MLSVLDKKTDPEIYKEMCYLHLQKVNGMLLLRMILHSFSMSHRNYIN